jgi:hypothetical protein
VFAARYELNSYIVFRKRLVSKRLTDSVKQGAAVDDDVYFPCMELEGSGRTRLNPFYILTTHFFKSSPYVL